MCILHKINSISVASPTEVLVLDTNVLLWTFYPKLSPHRVYQTHYYPLFISKAIAQKNQIIVTTFCLNEMIHVVEKTEYDLYKRTHPNLSLKDYRKIPIERSNVKNEIELILKQLQTIPTLRIIKSKANRKTIRQFTYHYNIHLADFFDFCLMSFCNNHRYAIVSDDVDFNSTFFKGALYSANPKL